MLGLDVANGQVQNMKYRIFLIRKYNTHRQTKHSGARFGRARRYLVHQVGSVRGQKLGLLSFQVNIICANHHYRFIEDFFSKKKLEAQK